MTVDLDIFKTFSSIKKKKTTHVFLNFESLKYIISTLLDYFCLLFFSLVDNFS